MSGLRRPRPGLAQVDPASLEPRRREVLSPGERAARRARVVEERAARARAEGRVPLAERMTSTPPSDDEEV